MKIIPKILQQQNRWAYFLDIFDVNNLEIWLFRKQAYFISRKRLYERDSWFLKRTCENEKHDTVNKKRIKITRRCKRLLYLWKRNPENAKDINYQKTRNHCHYIGKYKGVAHSIWNLKSKTFNEIPVVFHNGSNYEYHFIMKELRNKFQGQFESLGKRCWSLWKYRFNETTLSKKQENYSKLSKEDIIQADYKHGKTVSGDFEINHEYYF